MLDFNKKCQFESIKLAFFVENWENTEGVNYFV